LNSIRNEFRPDQRPAWDRPYFSEKKKDYSIGMIILFEVGEKILHMIEHRVGYIIKAMKNLCYCIRIHVHKLRHREEKQKDKINRKIQKEKKR